MDIKLIRRIFETYKKDYYPSPHPVTITRLFHLIEMLILLVEGEA